MDRPMVRFCRTADGVRIAYAVMGAGSPIVVPPHRVTHLGLEYPGQGTYEGLLRHHTLIRYDKRGTGLSERNVSALTPAMLQLDIEAVVAAAALERFSIFAHSDASPIAIDYAIAHSEQVSHIVFLGGAAKTPEIPDWVRTQIGLRRVDERFAARQAIENIVPDGGTRDWVDRFTEYSMASITKEVGEVLDLIQWHDQRPLLPLIEAEVLVLHRVGDAVRSMEEAHELAGSIPRARLLLLPGRDHLPTTPEQAEELVEPMLSFFPRASTDLPAVPLRSQLTARQIDVACELAEGRRTSVIASRLSLSPNTVKRHISNILAKTGLENRTQIASRAVAERLADFREE